jgi:hypothetical protein
MQILAIRHNSTTGETTDFTGQLQQEIASVNGDVVLIAAQLIQQDLNGATIDQDLTGVLSLRATVGEDRQEGTTVLAFQDVYNTGALPLNEDLSTGKVTWLISLNNPAITTALDTNEFIDVVLEFTILTADNYPQTLAQIPYRIYAQVDNGAVGVPPPSSPTYYTAVEIDALVAGCLSPSTYIVPLFLSVDTTLTAIAGIQHIFVDTTAGTVTITLPDAATSDVKWSPVIVNVGTGTLNVATTGGDTLNNQPSPLPILAQFAAVALFNDPSNARYLSPLMVFP